MAGEKPIGKKFRIEISEETKRGHFVNNVSTWHSKQEFIIDFGLQTPESIAAGNPTIIVQSRCIMTPLMFKILAKHVENSLKGYEKKFGKIQLPKKPGAKKKETQKKGKPATDYESAYR